MTTPLFKKMNLKDQKEILVLNSPPSFEAELEGLRGVKVHRKVAGLKAVDFAIAFVIQQAEVDAAARILGKLAKGDAVVWFAYPKQSSKRYKSEIHRDRGWDVVGKEGFEPVRAVAIDEDWSGLRVRRVEFIKTMKRSKSAAKTVEGKKKAQGK
jgi:hypothetical protein